MSLTNSSRSIAILIFSISTAVQVVYALLIYRTWGHTFLTADSVTHMYIGRILWDNLANIGGIWLPFFHLLMAPFTLNPFLYSSGLAGVIVNSIATGLTSFLIYRMMPNRYGLIVSMVFAANIFTLSFSSTPMQESTAILFAVWAISYLAQYLRTQKRTSFLKMAAVLTVGEFTRYEVWVLAAILGLVFIINEVRHKRAHNIAFVHLPFWGIFLWLIWGLAIFRDPLALIHAYSPLGGAGVLGGNFSAVGLLFDRADIQVELIGIGLASIAFAASFKSTGKRQKVLSITVLAIYLATLPFQLTFFPTGAFAVQPAQAYGYHLVSKNKLDFQQVAKVAHSTILISTRTGWVGGDQLSVLAGVDPSRIIDEFDAVFPQASAKPWNYAEYVVISKTPRGSGFGAEQRFFGAYFDYLYFSNSNWRSQFDQHYQRVFETSTFVLYQKTA